MSKEPKHNTFFYCKEVSEVFSILDSRESGLTSKEVELRSQTHAPNEIPDKRRKSSFSLLISQFNNYLVYILLIATGLSIYLNNLLDAYLILAIIIINAAIGFAQEFKAEKSIEMLKRMIVPVANVYRDGSLVQITAKDLLPGDIIFLQEGDRIPADARLFEIKNLRANESSLTGESIPSSKDTSILQEGISISDQKNMVWMGTYIVSGEAKAIVTQTGLNTIIGNVAESLSKIDTKEDLFKKKTKKLAFQLSVIAIAGALATFLIGYLIRGIEFSEIFLFTLASIVAGIPEGLPAIIAIVLAIGARRMSKRNVIVRSLSATETLGHATIIATDKTGTLTQNTMTIEQLYLPNGDSYVVSGDGWETSGKFYHNNQLINPTESLELAKVLSIASLCNHAQIIKQKENKFSIIGDPTEAALVVLAEKAGLNENTIKPQEEKIDDFPFSKELRYRGSLINIHNNNHHEIYLVGAPESLLEISSYFSNIGQVSKIDSVIKDKITSQIEKLTQQGMRVLAFAYKNVPTSANKFDNNQVNDLVFAGIIGMKDPVRPEVSAAVEQAKKSGIRVIMKTGDHKGTALAIAKEIGLIDNVNSENKHPNVLTGDELEKMNQVEFNEAIKNVNVYARLTPQMKLNITSELQGLNEIVVMTGDGVNDAPALKKADVGISMGIIGTDVARASSKIVLADDNFASIIKGIKEGRIVFDNIKRVAYFLLTTNFAEGITIILALLLGFALPLLPVQILWLNLITDGIVVLALAMEPGSMDIMSKKPKKENTNILVKDIVPFFLIIVPVMTISTLFIFDKYSVDSLEKARTGAFAVLAFSQLINVINMRSLDESIFKLGFFTNKYIIWSLLLSAGSIVSLFYVPFFQKIFSFTPLNLMEFIEVLSLSMLVLFLGEIYKFIKSKMK